ncbi:SDR family oxidoreductase [Nocardia sp. NPDC051030]|uniref:SDR family NAD(P)-dependent oxidoreductase n=1 Tax=Nocardia sp. NPDC051030 TaxID=3155162 RepID=UPI003438250E
MGENRYPVAIVTGAGSALGIAVVRRLAACGFVIASVDLRAAWVEDGLTTADRAQSWTRSADVRYIHEAEATVIRAAEALGRPTVVVNAPFPGHGGHSGDVPDWEAVLHDRLRAPLLITRAAQRYLAGTGNGRIINVTHADISARRPVDVVTDKALHALTETLAHELAPQGIQVNTVVAETCGAHGRRDCCVAVESETASIVEFLVSQEAREHTGHHMVARHPVYRSPGAGGLG